MRENEVESAGLTDVQTESVSGDNGNAPIISYKTDENGLYKKNEVGDDVRIANFFLEIRAQKIMVDERDIVDRSLDIDLHLNGRIANLSVSMDDFSSGFLMNRIYDVAGSTPILYGGVKDLRIGTQELSPKDISTKIISTSTGLTPEGNFLYPGMLITAEGINIGLTLKWT